MLPGPGRAPEPKQCLGVRSQADPLGLSRGQAHADCWAPIRGGGGGWDLVTAGAEVPRGRERTLLEQDRLRFPSHSLTHSLLASAQAGGIAPKEVAARTLRLDVSPTPNPPPPAFWTSVQSAGVDPWGSQRESPGFFTRVPELRKSTVGRWGGMCADSGHACTCRNSFACVAAVCVSARWGARALQRRGERGLGTPGSLVWRWGASSLLKPAGCEPLARGSRAGPGEGS